MQSDGPILLVHRDRRLRRSVQRILGGTLRPLRLADDADGARACLADGGAALLVASADVYREVGDGLGDTPCLVLAEPPHDQAIAMLSAGHVMHLVASPMPGFSDELVATAHKLLSGDLFGLEKYLSWGTPVRETEISSTLDRRRALEELSTAFEALGMTARLAIQATLIADELLSNAVFNAPVDAAGYAYLREQPRDIALPLIGRERPRLRWGSDARYLAIEVDDAYGSLDPTTLFHHVCKAGQRGAEIRTDTAGAGLGLAMVYAASSQLVCNLEPGRRTQVIGLIDLRLTPGATAAPLPSFHLFRQEAARAA